MSLTRTSLAHSRVGVVCVARLTFDTELAASLAARAMDVIADVVGDVRGEPTLMTEPTEVATAVGGFGDTVDAVVVVQATFTDARFIATAAEDSAVPVLLWAFPDQRNGERLALNALCGLILASFELGQHHRRARWLLADPGDPDAAERLATALSTDPQDPPPVAESTSTSSRGSAASERARAAVERLSLARVGVVGRPPDGFGPCGRHADAERRAAVAVESFDIDHVLDLVPTVHDDQVERTRTRVRRELIGLDDLEASATTSSLQFHAALDQLRRERRWDSLALRCWPESFERLGCSACTPMALLNEDGIAAACEADALGAITMMVLGWLGESRPALVDLVDIDREDDTAVVWHCGVAPAEFAPASRPARAANHPNRELPLVQHLVMKPGRVTVARLSQSRGTVRMVIGGADALDRPMPYLGSSGVLRFDRPATEVLDTVVSEGLEHHLALVYGDCRAELEAVAALLEIPTVNLT